MQQEESLRYAIYSSPYDGVLQRVWTEETESVPMEETPKDGMQKRQLPFPEFTTSVMVRKFYVFQWKNL